MVSSYTVVIPAFNAESTLAATVNSVLGQTILPARIIIVDDGSTDKTAQVAQALCGPVQLIRQNNQGPGAATTTGLARCETPYIATVDADDIWLPEKIEKQFVQLLENPDLAAVFCRLANFYNDPQDADFANARGGWSRSTMLIKHDICMAIGPIVDPVGRAGEMIDWFARGLEQGHRMHLMDEPLALRRIHPGSLTYSHKDIGSSYLQVARAALLRRRAVKQELP
jgi:glycosyltransferase involved in cell wall biosynthesis